MTVADDGLLLLLSSSSWGSWEELVLGGAVLRHGTNGAWDAVAAEVRARSSNPHLFTPQECQARYEDIQEQYSGCDAWFEELRKQRVAELRRELEKSEDSIGSLQSKLESLTSERDMASNSGYNTSRTETMSPAESADGIKSSKEISKGGSSAGSFTEKPGRNQSPECQNLASVSIQESRHKIQTSNDFMKAGCVCTWTGFGKLKGKRGKRKRKGYHVVEEDSVGDSDRLSSAVLVDREGSLEGHHQDVKLPDEDSSGSLGGEDDSHLDLARILDSIMKRKDVSIFRQRLESQKRARYKKMIRRHVDFRSIISKIGNGSISSTKELWRDLLLLSNNALVFFSKDSPERKSALILRDLVSNNNTLLVQSCNSQHPTRTSGDDGASVLDNAGKPKRPKILQPCNPNPNPITTESAVVSGKGDDVIPVKENSKKRLRADVVVVTCPGRKRGIGRPVKRGGKRQQESPKKGRKRVRR